MASTQLNASVGELNALNCQLNRSVSQLNASACQLNPSNYQLNRPVCQLNPSDDELNPSVYQLNRPVSQLNPSDNELNRSDSQLNQLVDELCSLYSPQNLLNGTMRNKKTESTKGEIRYYENKPTPNVNQKYCIKEHPVGNTHGHFNFLIT